MDRRTSPRQSWNRVKHASEVEIRFTADGPDRTTVGLEHRHLDRLVGGQAMREAIGGAGWTSVLERYATAAASEE